MFPAVSARSPEFASTWAIREVVVVLPFVPVIPMHRVSRSATNPMSTSARASVLSRNSAPCAPSGLERRHLRRNPRGHYNCGRPADALQVVTAQVHLRAGVLQGAGPLVEHRPTSAVGRINGESALPEEKRRRDAALAESHYRHFPVSRKPSIAESVCCCGGLRTLRVDSATSAQSKPRM